MGNDLKGLMRRLTGIRVRQLLNLTWSCDTSDTFFQIEVSEDKRARRLECPEEDVDAYLEKLGLTKQELLTDAFVSWLLSFHLARPTSYLINEM